MRYIALAKFVIKSHSLYVPVFVCRFWRLRNLDGLGIGHGEASDSQARIDRRKVGRCKPDLI